LNSVTATDKLRVVYVAGSGHTGSTLVAMLLNAHPQIVSVGETSIKPKIRRRGDGATQKCSCGVLIVECAFWQEVFGRVAQSGHDFSAHTWKNDYRNAHPLIHRVLSRDSSHKPIRAFQYWASDHLPIYSRRVHHTDGVNVAFIRALLETAKAEVFVDTSKHVLRMFRLMRLAELDVKVVTLVRDVRGYAASAKRRGLSIMDAASTWRKDQEIIEHVTRNLAPERKIVLRYEDLCIAPEETLTRLYAFCGVEQIPPVTSLLSSEHHVIGNSMRFQGEIRPRLDETWRSRLEQDEQRRVLNVAGHVNQRFGYV
jgi:hypothetical protein